MLTNPPVFVLYIKTNIRYRRAHLKSVFSGTLEARVDVFSACQVDQAIARRVKVERDIAGDETLPGLLLSLALQENSSPLNSGQDLFEKARQHFRDGLPSHDGAVVDKVGSFAGQLFFVEGKNVAADGDSQEFVYVSSCMPRTYLA